LGPAAGEWDSAGAGVDIKVFVTDKSKPSTGADDIPYDVKGAKAQVYKKTLSGTNNYMTASGSPTKTIYDYSVTAGKTYYAGMRLAAWADASGIAVSSRSDFSNKDNPNLYHGYARFKSLALKLR
ncbi:MAG: hypothetical protein GY869_24530, partial [Planctomycetes bacterium]|nr:hypothetical protein [Planctomycetota bacterium]